MARLRLEAGALEHWQASSSARNIEQAIPQERLARLNSGLLKQRRRKVVTLRLLCLSKPLTQTCRSCQHQAIARGTGDVSIGTNGCLRDIEFAPQRTIQLRV